MIETYGRLWTNFAISGLTVITKTTLMLHYIKEIKQNCMFRNPNQPAAIETEWKAISANDPAAYLKIDIPLKTDNGYHWDAYEIFNNYLPKLIAEGTAN